MEALRAARQQTVGRLAQALPEGLNESRSWQVMLRESVPFRGKVSVPNDILLKPARCPTSRGRKWNCTRPLGQVFWPAEKAS